MPKVWQKYIKSGCLSGLWKISESEEELRQQLVHFPEEHFSHQGRTRQWLASRVLLQEMLKEMGHNGGYSMEKSVSGQPRLSIPGLHVSISHAGEYAAIALSEEPIGVDIEQMGERIRKIAPRFMNESELGRLKNENDLVWMHTVWSAKEALFKYFPSEAIDFKKDLHIDQVSADRLQCRVVRGNAVFSAQVPYLVFDNYVIAWAWGQLPSE